MTKKKSNKADLSKETYCSDDDSLRLYLREISRIPLLNKEEEEKIARLAIEGNNAAREKLVNSNLRFVIMIAKKYRGKGLPLQDLISEGNIGLLNALKHFDVEKGYRFITYAVWWIRQAIIKAIQEKGRMIRLPSNKANELSMIEKSREEILKNPGMKYDEEIRDAAVFLEMTPGKAAELVTLGRDTISLEEPIYKSDVTMMIKDSIEDNCYESPVEYAINSVLRDEMDTIVNSLEKRSAEIIRCRYGLGDSGMQTLREVGDRNQLSRERIRQIEQRALLQLSSRCTKLESYIAG